MSPLYLQENFAKDSVRLLLEDGGEDDCDAIGTSLYVNRLFVAVMNLHQLARIIPALQLLLCLECCLEGCG